MGRLTRNPDIRYSNTNGEQLAIARYTLAVDRRYNRNGDQTADFISCVVFGKGAEFAEKYLKQGTKIAVIGRIQTGSYTNRDGIKVYTTDVVVEEQEFAESKNAGANRGNTEGNQYTPYGAVNQPSAGNAEFMNIPEGIENDLPFS
jgi:single-strand DNA-binding protein